MSPFLKDRKISNFKNKIDPVKNNHNFANKWFSFSLKLNIEKHKLDIKRIIRDIRIFFFRFLIKKNRKIGNIK